MSIFASIKRVVFAIAALWGTSILLALLTPIADYQRGVLSATAGFTALLWTWWRDGMIDWGDGQ